MVMEHKHTVIHFKDGNHGLFYGYFLNKMFKNFQVECVRGVICTIKKIFTMNTLIKNKCMKGTVGTRS